jgi:TRAP-type C4-dicarboxylate transport system permease small subunit
MTKSPFEPIYRLSAFLAVAALVAIATIILADVALRQFGRQIRSSDDFAVFYLAATAFLGLGPTYRRNEHIRVGLLVDRLTGRTRRIVETVVLSVATIVVGWAAWWACRFTYDSWRFHEVSQGLVPVPLWIPQSAMALGLVILLLAVIEDLARIVMGRDPSYLAAAGAETALPTFER